MIQMAKGTLKKIIKGQKGQVLPIVLVLLAIGGLLIAPTLYYASTSLKTQSQVYEFNTLELYSADSGIEDALHWLIHGKETGGAWSWNEGEGYWERVHYFINSGRDVYVNVEERSDLGANIYKITSTATTLDAGSTTVLSTVWAITWFEGDTEFDNSNLPPSGDVHVEGDVSFAGNIDFTGDLTCSGSVTTMNNAQITGKIKADGDVILENNSEIHGTLCSGGDITLGNGCVITGEIRIWKDGATISIVQAGAYIEANIWADGNSTTIDIQYGSAAYIELLGDIYAPAGDILIYLTKDNSEIQGDIYASGTIQILDDTGTHTGTQYPSHAGEPPFDEPDCPEPPTDKGGIVTYEIT